MSILERIAKDKRQHIRVCKARVNEAACLRQAGDYQPLDFAKALQDRISLQENAVIAEVKKASPSRGIIRQDFEPVSIAKSYEQAHACCLSVLTDTPYFQGKDDYLKAIRKAVSLPLLRKDFMLDPYQIIEARAMGADAILIIMAMIDDQLIAELCATAKEMNLSILPEVHNEAELERALELDTPLLGINNRNLHDFSSSLETSIQLAARTPAGKNIISESGIYHADDLRTMNKAGIYGFLVGESLMRQPDPGEALTQLLKT